ncbi:MAG: RAMP superfamily CRISPR-associated protein [Candidatus Helarchaeota archaeon]
MDKYIDFLIKIKTPTFIKKQRYIGNIHGTLRYITGFVIFGAIGNYLLRNYCDKFKNNNFKSIYYSCTKCSKKCEFFKLILSTEKIICNDAIFMEKNTNNFKDDEIIRNLKSLIVCRKSKDHIFDNLIYYLENHDHALPTCKICNSSVKRTEKSVYLYQHNTPQLRLKSFEPDVLIIKKTGIDGTLGSAKENILYQLECIEPNQTFKSRILYNETLTDIVKESLNGIQEYGIGGNRNRGFGKIQINILKEYSCDDYIESRLKSIEDNSEILSNRLNWIDDDHEAIIITLKSDLNLMPFSFIPDGNDFVDLINSRFSLNLPKEKIKLIKFIGKKNTRTQYLIQNQADLMIINQIEAGSILIYTYPKSIKTDLLNALTKSELYHLGWYPERGLGHIICNSKIHFIGDN